MTKEDTTSDFADEPAADTAPSVFPPPPEFPPNQPVRPPAIGPETVLTNEDLKNYGYRREPGTGYGYSEKPTPTPMPKLDKDTETAGTA